VSGKIALRFVALTCTALLTAGCTYSHVAAEKYIRDSEEAWAQSVATNDASVLKRILADDFVWVLPDGDVWNKQRAIADAESGPGDFVSDHVDDMHVRFFGNTAVAQGSETWERQRGSMEQHGRFVWSDTWVLRDGEWQIVQAEDLIAPVAR